MLLSGRIVWPSLFTPRAFEPGDTPKYQCSLLIPKDDPQAKLVIDEVQSIVKDKLGGKEIDARYFPIKDGDKDDNPAYHGHIEVRMKNTRKPGVVDQKLQPIIDPDLIRGGDVVNIDCGFFHYDKRYKGVGCSLNNVQFIAKGDPIGAAAKRPEDVFTPIEGAGGGESKAGAIASFLS